MAWYREAISDGEIDALRRVAIAACNDDTRYPAWHGRPDHTGGHCYVISRWLVDRLAGSVGQRHGHYVWLSPDTSYYLDLTGDHGAGVHYLPNDGQFRKSDTLDNARTDRFTKRANRLFDSLDHLLHLSLDYAGDAYPAEEPQRADDLERFNDSGAEPESYWHDEPGSPQTPEGLYQFVYANGQLEVSPNHSHDELSEHAGVIPAQHTGPFAAGHVVVTTGRATWEVQANVNLHAMFRILKDASKSYGWQWGGMTDASGQPIIEDFAPKKSATVLRYAFIADHLYLGRTSTADLAIRSRTEGPVLSGTLRILGTRAEVAPVHIAVLPHLFEWAEDARLTLYAGNDNVIKTIPDLQLSDNYNPQSTESPNPHEPPAVDERLPTGLYRCPACDQLFPNWHEYQKHRREQESWGDSDRSSPNSDYGLPQGDKDSLYGDGAHFHERRSEPGITTGKVVVLPARTWKEAARVDGFEKWAKVFNYDNDDYHFYVAYRNGDPLGYAVVTDDGGINMLHSAVEHQGIGRAIYRVLAKHYRSLWTYAAHEKTATLLKRYGWVQSKGQLWRWSKDQAPADLLEGPLPFIYDVQEDKVHVGHPGARTSDIPGRFTPGGIVEGNYEPGGKVVIRSLTSIPYTVRHMIELWYYSHPQLEVKSVHLQDDQGKDTRLASQDIGSYVKTLATMDPAVHTATQTLQMAGGEVYAVGGAVRDAVMGREPNDIDLMVTGIPAEKVSHLLQSLPGRVDFTGKDFGVFRYRHKGHEVEIALPRRDRSTGAGHQDFDVQADPTMKPEDDFYRRDFTANAMGINLANGKLVDPFNGQEDIANSALRTLHDKSLTEDPLRVVRALVANARHGLQPDESTRAQMTDNAHMIQHLPPERIQHELDKIMSSDNPARAIRLAHETGVLQYILPEVEAAFGYDQNNPHHELELGDHLVNVLDRTDQKTDDPDLRLAALLHDIGKPGSAWQDPETGSNHYYEHHSPDGSILGKDHEAHGADLVRQRMSALRYPGERINRVSALVNHHMWPAFTTDRGARRFLQRVGDHADDLMTLRWADQGGKDLYPSDPTHSLDNQRRLIQRARNAGEATNQSQLAINGHDLIAAGIPPGPQMGQLLRDLTNRVVDDPALNNRDALLQLARQSGTLYGQRDDRYGDHQHSEDSRPPQGTRGRQAYPVQDAGQERSSSDARLSQAHSSRQQSIALTRLAQDDGIYWPSEEEAIGANQEAYQLYHELFGDDATWGGVLKPNELSSALASAKNHYYYGPEEDELERLAQAAGKMAWRIAGNQVFTNGNKRTAFWMTRKFLDENGLGHLSPVDHDDYEFADHLIGQDRYGADRTMTPEQLEAQRAQLEQSFQEMWRDRYYQGGPDPAYQQQYPEGTYMVDPYEAAQNPPNVPDRP